MEINGERLIGASQKTVWDAINDPEILKRCIPGGESVERVGDNEMKAVVMAKPMPLLAPVTIAARPPIDPGDAIIARPACLASRSSEDCSEPLQCLLVGVRGERLEPDNALVPGVAQH